MADLFDVIADPTRRELLRALLERTEQVDGPGEVSVGELVAELSLSQPTVSKHLKTLRDFSLVTVREQGQHRFYRLDPMRLEPIAEWLGAFLKPSVVPAESLEPEAAAVVAAAPEHPLSPGTRAFAVRLGARAAGVTAALRARRASEARKEPGRGSASGRLRPRSSRPSTRGPVPPLDPSVDPTPGPPVRLSGFDSPLVLTDVPIPSRQ